MGVLGMLLFIPLCSVVYSLFRAYVKDRLTARNVPAEKWRDPPPPAAPPRKKTGHRCGGDQKVKRGPLTAARMGGRFSFSKIFEFAY